MRSLLSWILATLALPCSVLRGWFTEDPAYTLQSVYNQAPVF